jgi:hypothetical protein
VTRLPVDIDKFAAQKQAQSSHISFLIKSITFLFINFVIIPLFLYFALGPPCLLHYTDWPTSHETLDHTGLNHSAFYLKITFFHENSEI